MHNDRQYFTCLSSIPLTGGLPGERNITADGGLRLTAIGALRVMFGWQRVPRAMHLLATSMVAIGGSMSAFWILVANSWMQTPAGGIW